MELEGTKQNDKLWIIFIISIVKDVTRIRSLLTSLRISGICLCLFGFLLLLWLISKSRLMEEKGGLLFLLNEVHGSSKFTKIATTTITMLKCVEE